MGNLGRLARTLRHLRPIQIGNRLWRRLPRGQHAGGATPSLRQPRSAWVEGVRRRPQLLAADRIELLSLQASIASAAVWRDGGKSKLWLYQLHYFDDLNAAGAGDRRHWHRALITRWIDENPPGSAVAWDPYPISLRVVNWIKWQLGGAGGLTARDLASLAAQVRYLLPRLEHHLLGNHLLENYKALFAAGCFFEGPEAEKWRARGLAGLRTELGDQVLPEGAHNELAPMYHAILTEGVLDTLNLHRVFGFDIPDWLADVAGRMVAWGSSITHPDGQWPQFNDTELGSAASAGELSAYFARLGFTPRTGSGAPCSFERREFGDWVLLADLADLGPDHNPGHGHADNLTYELSMGGRRVIVDTGISTYEVNDTRARERSTAAHNTVVVDGQDSSEVWESFRVGRRAHTRRLEPEGAAGASMAAEHDGYRHLPGAPIHRREWRWQARRLEIHDRLRTRGSHQIVAHVHLHPDYNPAVSADGGCAVLDQEGRVIARVFAEGWTRMTVSDYEYAPAFGRRIAGRCIELAAPCDADTRLMHVIEGA
jgi:uncharacterized heparinase superfamily protein